MQVGIACGGTGGHVFPGLAVGRELRGRGHGVTLWVSGRGVEDASLDGWDGEVCCVPACGLPGHLSPGAITSAFSMIKAVARARRLMRKAPPDVFLGMGSYASVGPVLAARSLRVPVVLHEANAVPGRAVSFLSRVAQIVAVGFDEAGVGLAAPTRVTGFPLRETFRSDRAPASHETFTLLVTGGSQGAHRLNETASEAVGLLKGRGRSIRVFHLTGKADESMVRERYAAQGVDAAVDAFRSDIAQLYRSADLAITRAGAATCAELAATGLPALLVPLPSARRDHQRANADALERVGAARVVDERELSPDLLADYIDGVADDDELRARMAGAMKEHACPNATAVVADLVEEIAAS